MAPTANPRARPRRCHTEIAIATSTRAEASARSYHLSVSTALENAGEAYHFPGIRHRGRPRIFRRRREISRECEIVRHRAREHHRRLKHERDSAAKLPNVNGLDGRPEVHHRALGRIVESVEQPNE